MADNETKVVTLEPLPIKRNDVELVFSEHEKTRPPKDKGKKYYAPKIVPDNLDAAIAYFGRDVASKILYGRVKQWAQAIHKDSTDKDTGEFFPNKFINYAQTYSVRGGESIKELRNELAELNAELGKLDLTALASPTHAKFAEVRDRLTELAKDIQDVQAQIELKARNKDEDEDEEEAAVPATA